MVYVCVRRCWSRSGGERGEASAVARPGDGRGYLHKEAVEIDSCYVGGLQGLSSRIGCGEVAGRISAMAMTS